MTFTLRGGVGSMTKTKMRCYWTWWGRGLASVLDVQSLFFILKRIGFATQPDIMLSQTIIILLTKNLRFDSDVRQ